MSVRRQLDFDESRTFHREHVYFSEKRWAICGIIVSCCVLVAKLLFLYGDAIRSLAVETRLIRIDQLSDEGQMMFTYAYENTVRYSSLWLPVLCGFIATYITWLTVYLDSEVPGIHPPSPLSPQKFKQASGHVFHLNYVFALVIGGLITAYMYANGIQIKY